MGTALNSIRMGHCERTVQRKCSIIGYDYPPKKYVRSGSAQKWGLRPLRFCKFKSLAKKGESSCAAGHKQQPVSKMRGIFHSKVLFLT